jgi:uncharacterized membrane protein (Fun14 family)
VTEEYAARVVVVVVVVVTTSFAIAIVSKQHYYFVCVEWQQLMFSCFTSRLPLFGITYLGLGVSVWQVRSLGVFL